MGRKKNSRNKEKKGGGGLNKVILSIGTTLLLVTLFCTTNIVEEQHAIVSQTFSSAIEKQRSLTGGTANTLLDSKLRVAFFGQTTAYGGGLMDKSNAYPHLMSNNEDSHDYAHNSLGPNHYSICLDSIIHFSRDEGDRVPEDRIYDIIILDYWLLYDQGLSLLAERLSRKYPHAMIILLKTNAAAPHFFRRKTTDGYITFMDWVKNLGDDVGVDGIKEALKGDEGGEWFVPHHDKADAAIDQIAENVEGHVLSFPSTTGNLREGLIDYLDWYDDNKRFHLNSKGHERLAFYLKEKIQKEMYQYGKSVDEFVRKSNQQTPETPMKDYCDWWWYHGMGSTVSNRGGPLFREIDDHNHHWVMEIGDDYTAETTNLGSLFASHEGTENRDLYLSYMIGPFKGLDRAGAQYPSIVAGSIRTKDKPRPIPFEIDIHPNDGHEHFDFVTTLVQKNVPPGVNHVITLRPIYRSTKPGVYDVSQVDKIPFRLVGYAFTNEEPMKWEFGPRGA